MAKNATSQLLIAAFPAEKQSGTKVRMLKRGEDAPSATEQQHGELASAESPQRPRSSKPKEMSHSSKALLSPSYDSPLMHPGKKGKSAAESPSDRVEREAHRSKVEATRRWVEGNLSGQEHDAIHRRANAVLKYKGRRP